MTVELNELTDDSVLTEHVGNGEDHVCRSHAGGNLTRELKSDNAWHQHRHRLAEHGSLSLNTADAPAQNSEAVFHRRVGVSTDTCIRVGKTVTVEHDAGEVLDVHLVNNACSWGDNPEVVESTGAPTEELVALVIALVFNFNVLLDGIFRAERFDNH